MDLSGLYGHPIWARAVHSVLSSAHEHLHKMFMYYSKAIDPRKALNGLSLGYDELVLFLNDCNILNDKFTAERLQQVLRESLRVRDLTTMALSFPQFLHALVAMSFDRANPDGPPSAVEKPSAEKGRFTPFPDCLQLLMHLVLPSGKRDTSLEEREALLQNLDGQSALASNGMLIQELYYQLQTDTDRGVGLLPLNKKLLESGVLGEVRVKIPAPRSGIPSRKITTNMDSQNITLAFVNSRVDADAQLLGLTEFKECLLRIADVRFANVEEMDLGARLKGLVSALMEEISVAQVIFLSTKPRLDRTQAPEVPEGPLAQEWSECWSQLDLSGVYGFPLWEADVHNLLLANYDPLCAVFLAYAAPSKPGCPTMLQITMVERLLRDSKVWPNPAISSRNLIETMVKGGICGPGVEPPPYNLPAMLELFVKLSFHLANPMHGESGNASDDQEDRPLPECLEKMLNQYILKKAKRDYALLKRDRLANVKERAIVFHDLEEQLKSLFAELVMQSTTPENVTVNAPGVSPVVFNKLLVDAGLMGKTTVKRRAGIAGDKSREKVEIGVTAQQAGRLYNSALGARLMLIREGTMIFLSYADFKEAIVHVATSAYVQVVEMDDATALKATIKNMLQHEKPTLSVAASALDGQTGRVNVWRDSQQLPNESRSDYQVWVNTWHNIDISGVPGFPEWEREVHDMLHISFIQLMSIFSYYSKSRTRNNMVAAKSLDSGEFTSFCRDVKMFNSKFDELRGSDLFQKCANANSSDPKHAKAEELEPKHRLLLADFLRLLVEISFHRANPSYQPTGKAEDVVAPLPDCLNKLLHEVVLPNAKQDNAPSFRRRFSSDSKAQDVVHARAEDINRLWKALSGGNTQGVGIDAFLSFASKRQLMPTCEVYVSDEHVRPPTNKNKRIYRSSLSLEHARIAFIDSEASDLTLEGAGTAQAINTFLNLQEFTEALARMGDKKYELIEQMQLSDRIEAFLSNVFEGVATEDSIRAFIAPPPPRFDPGKRCNALKGETAEELQHFVHCWSCIKMHDIHGFPHFEESVCEVLHLHFKLLLATFAFYAGISGDTSATKIEAVGLRNLSTSQWIEFVKVSNICTRSFEQHRAVNAFHASRTGGSDVMPPNSSNESSCTFPEFLSALLRVSFWRANPLFAESRSLVEVGLVHSEAQAEAALVPLGECFPKLLTTNVLPRAKRANMRVRWLSMISSESMVSALLPTLLRELKAVYAVIFDKNFEDATKTEKEDARGQLEVTPVDHFTQLPIERVIRLLEKTKVIGRTEVKQDTGVTPMPNETPVIFVADLPERVARQLLIDSYHAVMANATPTVLTPNPPLIEIGRAQLQEFVCCASEVKYSALHEHMPLLNRLRSLLLNMLGKEFPHDTIAKAIRTEGPKRIDATAMVKQLHVLGTGAEGEFMQELWLAAWQRLRLNVLPGFPLWEQEVFRCFATDFCEVIYPVYLFYCRCKSDSCATVVRGRSLGIEEWLQFCSDCRLVTRNFDLPALRKLHGQCVPNTPDDGLLEARLLLPDFMTALTMLSFKRNNASWLKALPPDTLPPRPLPGCLIEVLQSNVVPHARRDPTSNLLKSLKQAPKVMELLEEHNGSLQELHKSLWVSSSSSPRVKAVEMQKVLSMLKAKRIFAVQHVQQKSAVTGDPDCMVVHKSTLDNATAARCFVAASRATFFRTDEAVATRGLLVFDEFLDFLMLLANAKYGDIAGMEPATQLKALIQNLIGVADTKAAIEEATFKSLSTTFNPRSGCKTDGTESTEEYEHWLACWDKVRLNQVIGFPLWLGDVHDILHSSLEQLRLIFGYYSKLPSTTAMPSTAMPSITATPSMTPMPEPPLLTLDMQKLMVLARDTSLLRKSFDDTKLSAIAKNYFTSIAEHGLNQGQMLFPDFLSLLVHVAFVRFNPRVTMNATKFPHIGEGAVIDAPVALCRLLDEVIFPDAKQDDRFLFRQRISAAPGELGDVIARRRNDLEDMFKKCCSMNSVPLHAALSFMTSREVLKDVAVQQRSAITADEARLTVHHSTLNVSHVRRAFTDSLPEEALRLCELDMLSETSTKLQLGQESFLEFVARCAMAKYGSVKGMGLPQMLDGFLDNLLKKRDEVEVIHAATDIPMPPRFDPFSEQNLLLPGEEKSEFDAWTMCWIVVRLEELPGFPVWERDVYDILHGEFVRLCQIFDVYCKSAGEDDEDAFAMNVNEWSFFCREIRISTKLFSLGRAESIFRYSMAPESNELMLPQFIEAIVHLAFQRFNPDLIRRPMYEARASKHVSVIDALKKLLQEHIFAHARQEDPNSFLRLLNEDKQALFVIKEYSTPIFRMLKLEGYLREGTDDRMEFAEALELAKKRNVLGFHNIEVQGSRPIVASLSEPQLRHSFLNARGGAAARVLGVDTLVGMEIMHMFAQCGDIAFSAVSKSTLHKRIEAFFQVLLHSADMQHVLLELGQRGLPPRFEAKKALTLLLDESVDEHEEWVQIFKSLSLHSLPGFPSWEQNIYNLLHGHWKELLSIFIFYCKKEKVTTSSAEVGLRLSAAGWLALIKQAQLAVPQKFEATAFLQLFFKVATGVVGMPEEPTEVLSELLYVWEQASQLRAKVATVPSLMSSVEEIARHSFDMYFQVEAEQPQTYSTPKIAFESFGEFLSRCGLVKYAKVPMMTTRDKVAAFLDNLTNKCDEETVIANATEQTTPPVFDAVKESVALLGEPEAQFAHWLACWKQLRLSSLFGFPLWLRELHEYLHQHFRQLHMIFAFYGIIKDEEPTLSSTLLLGMQEWLALARDCRLTTPEFTTHDLKDVFHQVASRSSEIALPGMIEALIFESPS
ncbi:hypothetical protein AB1Y20_007510 [Prymnesium parvum]|uniref:Calmodulin n=1 Tax=Prymnesium parvum TaxID=97485 RepID=A0AB34IY08_PRYPA